MMRKHPMAQAASSMLFRRIVALETKRRFIVPTAMAGTVLVLSTSTSHQPNRNGGLALCVD